MDYSTYLLPFGRYKTRPITEPPAYYFVSIYIQDELMEKWPEVKAYIELTYSALLVYHKIMKKTHVAPEPLCESGKQCFIDEEAAKGALRLIKHDKREHKKPHRAYLHDTCGFWHLTSEEKRES